MFHTEELAKIRVFGLQSQKAKIIHELHRLGVIEIRKSALEIADDGPGVSLPELSELVVRYNSAAVILKEYLKKQKAPTHHVKEKQPPTRTLADMAKRFKAVASTIELADRETSIEEGLAELEREHAAATLFMGMDIDFSQLSSSTLGFAAYLLGKTARKAGEKELAELGDKYQVTLNKTKPGLVAFVAYSREDHTAVEKLEHMPGVRKLEISSKRFESTPEKIVSRMNSEKKEMLAQRNTVQNSLEKMAQENYVKLLAILEMLNVEVERASVSLSFKRTASTFILEGWVEKKRVNVLSERLNEMAFGKFELEEIDTDELPPTLVKTGGFLRPYSKLVEFFSLPRSDELNPTLIFALTFPIFYGLMVSDVGYGIVSLLFAWFIARISDPDDILYNVAKVWQISSFAVIFFGFLSNQYFGFQFNQYFTSFAGFDWLKDTTTILAATVVFGILQVILGLLFSFINNYHHGHGKIALGKLTSIVAILAGTAAVAGSIFHLLPVATTQTATVLAIASLVLTIWLTGSESVEVISLISHPLSYARIMGFGLASVMLALLIDRGFTPSLSGGILGFVLVLIIFILLHFVNMLLGTFEGLVQAVRLNFVEFFSKFYTGGGVKFKPFFYKRRYTKEV